MFQRLNKVLTEKIGKISPENRGKSGKTESAFLFREKISINYLIIGIDWKYLKLHTKIYK